MTEPTPPTPEQRAEFARDVSRDLATARRFLAAMHARDHQGIAALTLQIVNSGRGTNVLNAMAMQAVDFAALVEPDEDRRQAELDRLAMEQLDHAEELERLGDDDT
jgi:hypothetical protein